MTAIKSAPAGSNEIWWLEDGRGSHGWTPLLPAQVRDSLKHSFRFTGDESGAVGLRAPQLGALHAILARRSTERTGPITIVMPTGTGKTETMLAAFAHSPRTTLVIVPSDALRTQVALKFASFGVLPEVGALEGEFLCPVVLVVKAGIDEVSEVDRVMECVNVVIATTSALNAFGDDARARLYEHCETLVIDEAHHVAAKTWRSIERTFAGREVLQFTATPYREDGQHLGGEIGYVYPLKLAQERGYFARIEYTSIVNLADPDGAVARASLERLRADLTLGFDHVLMARVGSVERGKEVLKRYEEIAADLKPIRLDTGLGASQRAVNHAALADRSSRVVVCVNMLGEGFDLPALKIAAIHDPQKSLGVTLQFVGRFTRTSGSSNLGDASAFVPLQVAGIDERLRRLYGEDADWNEVISDLTEQVAGRERERTDFERAFGSLPREVAMQAVHPKMSTVVYAAPLGAWHPEAIYDLFEGRLLTTKLGINNRDRVIWWVSREATPVRWGESASFNELVHHLYVVYVDVDNGFLYVNSTNNDSFHEAIAETVGGSGVELLKGERVYRVLARVNRRVPTNVGLLDSVSRNRRFSMHVGQDVLNAWRGDGGTKMKTNIFAHGYVDGRPVSFGASRKGRVWSHEQARDINDWVRWAREIGPIITDESISLQSVMSGFLLPEPATSRPEAVALGIEWPYQVTATLSESRRIEYAGTPYSLMEVELVLTTNQNAGPLTFEVRSQTWAVEYEFVFSLDAAPVIRPVGSADAEMVTQNSRFSLAAFLTKVNPFVTFEGELVLAEQGYLLRPDLERRLFEQSAIQAIDWSGINLRKESQGARRDSDSIQFRAIELLRQESDWDIVIDDDGPGELADVVLMRRLDDEMHVLFVHCKYSSSDTPGARIDELYDVCGQAMKMNRAKSIPDQLSKRLLRREQNRQLQGRSGLIVGDPRDLAGLVRDARLYKLRISVAIVQPGLSKARASEDMLALLGATDRFLLDTFGQSLRVIASD